MTNICHIYSVKLEHMFELILYLNIKLLFCTKLYKIVQNSTKGVIMKIQIWSKALLKSYSNLETVAKQIDNKVTTLALTVPGARYGNTTEVVANKILKYIDKKIILCKTKVLIEEVLMNIQPKYATVLKMKFVDNLGYDDIANYFSVSTRTVRRYIHEGIKYFSFNLEQKEYSPSCLAEMYKSENWIGRVYLSVLKTHLKSLGRENFQKFLEETDKDKNSGSYQNIYAYEI